MRYEVTIYQVWAESVKVTAKDKEEAKKKGWEKWKAKKSKYHLAAVSEVII